MEVFLPFPTESYVNANKVWPVSGRHIMASYKDDVVIVYQAYKSSIGEWVAKNQTFEGCPDFSMDRMTWIKPNFLWMMYRSGWASKKDQETILAIALKRSGFEEILQRSKVNRKGKDAESEQSRKRSQGTEDDDVRLQWDPDHDPHGEKVERRAIQLGIRGDLLRTYIKDWIVSIWDITEFVKSQRVFVQSGDLHLLHVPVERVYPITDTRLREHIDLDTLPLTGALNKL